MTATDKCFLPKSAGSCRASVTRYFYNASARECQRFMYGGCDGNSNNFESMKLCEEECERPLSPGRLTNVHWICLSTVLHLICISYSFLSRLFSVSDFSTLGFLIMRPSSLGGAAYCVALCLSVCLSVRPSRYRCHR